MADRHFRVEKQVIDRAFFALAHLNDEPILGFDEPPNDSESSFERTVVRVSRLEQLSHRQEEIALLAGGESGEEAMTFAESLLNQAKLKGVGSRE
jgi:DNA repair protein RecN (Recombination protein N)